MPYAHLWASGVTPYREQWYEYPPATIPLFYIPHIIDRETHNTRWHLNYSYAYRGLVALLETGLFAVILATLYQTKVSKRIGLTAIGYYFLTTIKAHDFIYDSMDIVFAGSWIVGLLLPQVLSSRTWSDMQVWFSHWLFSWLAIALKYINGPTLVWSSLELLQQWKRDRITWQKLGQQIVIAGVAGAIIWGVPLMWFRSSLSVSFVYHQIRGIQIDSTAALVARVITLRTKSESVIEVYKNYEISGPVTDRLKPLVATIFPISLVSILGLGSWLIWTNWQPTHLVYYKNQMIWLRLAWLHLGFMLVFLLTSKVLSRPFLLWQIPLFAALPWKRWQDQLRLLVPSFVMIVTTLSPAPNTILYGVPIPLWVGLIRCSCIILLLANWGDLTRKAVQSNRVFI